MKLYAHILHKASTADEKEKAQLVLNFVYGFIQFKFYFNISLFLSWKMLCVLQERLTPFMQSADLEVQERASTAVHVLKVISKLQDAGEGDVVNELMQLFQGELNPVAPKAQRKVPLPEG